MPALRWLTAPATDVVPRGHAIAAAGLRILVGLLWLYNVSWKRPPDFGQDSGKGLYGFTTEAVDHPVFPPFSWVVEHVVLPNFTLFGWGVLAVETALSVLLLTGAYVRVAAVIGIAQSLAIALSVAFAPGEWPWSYWMMIGIHALLLFSSAGSVLAIDALRARGDTAAQARLLTYVWGGTAVLAGVVAAGMSWGEDVFSASGARLGGPSFSVGLGPYNLAGALVLVVCGAALLGAAVVRYEVAAATAVVGGCAAVLLIAQSASSQSLLGGSTTSAAFFLSVAAVGAAVFFAGRDGDTGGSGTQRPDTERPGTEGH